MHFNQRLETPMRHALITLATALTTLIPAPTAHADRRDWADVGSEYGAVIVTADRKHITVCDTRVDDTEVWAEYATSFLLIHTLKDPQGSGCTDDSVFFGTITVFKLCFRHAYVSRNCDRAIWTNP